MTSNKVPPSPLRSPIDWVLRDPAAAIAALLCFHVAVWTILPILVCPNLQLDLAEGLALGREWQLGYWKHPPLPWWLTDLAYRIAGNVRVVYVLGPLSAAVCLFVVWRLARCVTGPLEAFAAVVVLEGIHFYNFSVVKFSHDPMQLPIWALTGYFYFRSLTRGRNGDWILAGVFLALAFWSKYSAFALAATLGLFLLLEPRARRTLATPGPWLMAAAFLLTLAPNLWWLVANDFLPFRHVEARATAAASVSHYLVYPLSWIGGQFLFLLPAIGLLALLLARRRPGIALAPDADAIFSRRIVTALAFGPFLATTVVAAALGRLPIAMWGYPLWSFAPLAVLLWFGPIEPRRFRGFVTAAAITIVAVPIAYLATEVVEPLVRERPKATSFPGKAMAEAVTREWRNRFAAPLQYAGGTEFAVNNLSVYSTDRPHVIVNGLPALSPWIDRADLARKGAVLIWEDGYEREHIDRWRALFGEVRPEPVLVLPRRTILGRQQARIVYAFIPPKP